MESLVKRIKWMGLGLIIMLFVMMFFALFIPLNRQIETSNKENFVISVDAYESSINHYIKNLAKLSNVMTSDSHNGHGIIEYLNDEKTRSELKEELAIRFNQNYLVSEACYLRREVNQVLLDEVGTQLFEFDYQQTFNEQSWLVTFEEKTFLIIYQPIIHESLYLGHDLYYFDLSIYVDENNQKGISYELFSTLNEVTEYLEAYDYYTLDGKLVYETNSKILVVGQIKDIYGFYMISIDKTLLKPHLERIYYNVAVIITFVFVVFFIFNGMTIYKVKKAMLKSAQKTNEYRLIADYDSLTYALSRSYFERWRKEFHQKAKEEGWFASLIMIDVDNLKQINDVYGHVLGDDVLREVGSRIQNSLRANDLFFRFGGDEFVLILEDCPIEIAEKILNRIISEVKAINHYLFDVEISYGIERLTNGDLVNDVIHKADIKMYKNKRSKKS